MQFLNMNAKPMHRAVIYSPQCQCPEHCEQPCRCVLCSPFPLSCTVLSPSPAEPCLLLLYSPICPLLLYSSDPSPVQHHHLLLYSSDPSAVQHYHLLLYSTAYSFFHLQLYTSLPPAHSGTSNASPKLELNLKGGLFATTTMDPRN